MLGQRDSKFRRKLSRFSSSSQSYHEKGSETRLACVRRAEFKTYKRTGIRFRVLKPLSVYNSRLGNMKVNYTFPCTNNKQNIKITGLICQQRWTFFAEHLTACKNMYACNRSITMIHKHTP